MRTVGDTPKPCREDLLDGIELRDRSASGEGPLVKL
jgi:hypothetical protein